MLLTSDVFISCGCSALSLISSEVISGEIASGAILSGDQSPQRGTL